MPRRSSRAVPAPAAAPAPIPKRRASDRTFAASETDLKRQKHNSTTAKKVVRSTARKSKYFEDEGNEESDPESSHASEWEKTRIQPTKIKTYPTRQLNRTPRNRRCYLQAKRERKDQQERLLTLVEVGKYQREEVEEMRQKNILMRT